MVCIKESGCRRVYTQHRQRHRGTGKGEGRTRRATRLFRPIGRVGRVAHYCSPTAIPIPADPFRIHHPYTTPTNIPLAHLYHTCEHKDDGERLQLVRV
jgi:hypothetical protein